MRKHALSLSLSIQFSFDLDEHMHDYNPAARSDEQQIRLQQPPPMFNSRQPQRTNFSPS